jgi:hypothetical protein
MPNYKALIIINIDLLLPLFQSLSCRTQSPQAEHILVAVSGSSFSADQRRNLAKTTRQNINRTKDKGLGVNFDSINVNGENETTQQPAMQIRGLVYIFQFSLE